MAVGEDVRAEVVNGELVVHMAPNKYTQLFAQRIATYLDVFASARSLGRVSGDMAAFKLKADEQGGIKGARVPDAAYISFDRLPAGAPLDVIPDFAPIWPSK